MPLADRLGRSLIRLAKREDRKASLDLDQCLAPLAKAPDSELSKIVHEAWAVGQAIDLTDVFYGPSHFKKRGVFVAETFPYYFFLAGLVRSQKCRKILEIGTHYGGSCLAMMQGAEPPTKIVTIDISDLNPALHQAPDILSKFTGDANSETIIKKTVLAFGGEPIDLLYVDAAHELMPTITNLGIYSLLFRPRLVVIDDIVLNDEMRLMWRVISATLGGQVVNCADIIPEIRGANVGFGLIRLR